MSKLCEYYPKEIGDRIYHRIDDLNCANREKIYILSEISQYVRHCSRNDEEILSLFSNLEQEIKANADKEMKKLDEFWGVLVKEPKVDLYSINPATGKRYIDEIIID